MLAAVTMYNHEACVQGLKVPKHYFEKEDKSQTNQQAIYVSSLMPIEPCT